MTTITNLISKSIYESALDEIKSTVPGWKFHHPDGTVERIARKQCKIIDDGHCIVYPFSHCYISERLKFPLISLDYHIPLFISAQTGAGKTQFVFNVLYPYLHSRNLKLLILVSRSKLKDKVKYDAIDAAGTGQRNDLTPSGIANEHHFGDIDVYSYQDFCVETTSNNHKREIEHNNYGAIVFDECHFFVADSDFNVSTEHILHYLTNMAYKNRIPRIYMTGTPDIVFDCIHEREINLWQKSILPYHFYCNLYNFERDYSYLQLTTFKNDKEHKNLLQLIKKADGAKWLIFVDSIEYGRNLMHKVEDLKKRVVFLSSETLHSKSGKDFELENIISDLTDNEKMSCDVLIATKCIDVGITIKDKNINIVNFLNDKVDFLQCIGRKRISGNETVNLLIPEYTISDVKHWLNSAKIKMEEFFANCHYYPEGNIANGNSVANPVYIEKGYYRHNHLAFEKLRYQIRNLQCLQTEIENSDLNDTEVITKFFSSWMPGCHCQCSVPDNDINAEIMAIVEDYKLSPMTQQDFESLAEQLMKYDTRTDQRSSRKKLSTRSINNIINRIGLKINRKVYNNVPVYQIIQISSKENN